MAHIAFQILRISATAPLIVVSCLAAQPDALIGVPLRRTAVDIEARLRERCMPLNVTHIEFQTAALQDVMNSSHHATFSLCSSASSALEMFHGVNTVRFCHYKITITERSLTSQSNQHRGTKRHQLCFVARRKTTLRHLGYFVNGPGRPEPASKRRNAAPMVKGSISEHGEADGHIYTIF